MSLLDEEELINNVDVLITYKKEELYAKGLLRYGNVACVVAEEQVKILQGGVKIYASATLAGKIKGRINDAETHILKEHQAREVISLDCRGLRKGDAYGWLMALSQQENNPIVIISNVSEIPDGDRNIYDDPVYVRKILLSSWKNEHIDIGDVHIDRNNMTVILTASNEGRDMLQKECGLNSYAWIGDYDERLKTWENIAKKTVEGRNSKK